MTEPRRAARPRRARAGGRLRRRPRCSCSRRDRVRGKGKLRSSVGIRPRSHGRGILDDACRVVSARSSVRAGGRRPHGDRRRRVARPHRRFRRRGSDGGARRRLERRDELRWVAPSPATCRALIDRLTAASPKGRVVVVAPQVFADSPCCRNRSGGPGRHAGRRGSRRASRPSARSIRPGRWPVRGADGFHPTAAATRRWRSASRRSRATGTCSASPARGRARAPSSPPSNIASRSRARRRPSRRWTASTAPGRLVRPRPPRPDGCSRHVRRRRLRRDARAAAAAGSITAPGFDPKSRSRPQAIEIGADIRIVIVEGTTLSQPRRAGARTAAARHGDPRTRLRRER